MLDTVDFPIAFWGAIRAGVVSIPLNTLLNAEQYAYMLGDSRVEAVFVSAPLARTIAPIVDQLPHLRMIVIAGGSADDKAMFAAHEVHLFEEVLAAGKAEPWTAPTISDEVAFWLYSSGSTGVPKGTKHVHISLIATAELYGQGVLGIRADDVVYSAAKLFFAYGLGNAMSFPMSVGASAVLMPGPPDPRCGVRADAARAPDHLLRRADALCGHARPQGSRRAAPAPTACARASRPARRCPPISARSGATGSASTSSTASARPRCCTSS